MKHLKLRWFCTLLFFIGAVAIGNSQQICAQTVKTVTGQVVDTNGEPMIGAAVSVKGQNKSGTITDLDGKYTIYLY